MAKVLHRQMQWKDYEKMKKREKMEQRKKGRDELRKKEKKSKRKVTRKRRDQGTKKHLTKISTKMILTKTQQLQQSFVHNALLKKIKMIMTPGSSVMGATYGTILSVLATRAGTYRN